MGLIEKFQSWKQKREYHKQNSQNVKLGKGEKLTEREKAIRSQGYMAGQRAAWDEKTHKTDKNKWEQTQIKRRLKREEFKANKPGN